MKAVLISIKPLWVEKIIRGEKTIEVRKTAPKIGTPFKVYIYETKGKTELPWVDEDGHYIYEGRGQIIGEFISDKIEMFSVGSLACDDIEILSCLSYQEMIEYFYKPEELDGKTSKVGYAWHITDLKIYDKPKELSEFFAKGECNAEICEKCSNYHEGRGWLDGSYYDENCCNNSSIKPITRPPQSWQYVEELK